MMKNKTEEVLVPLERVLKDNKKHIQYCEPPKQLIFIFQCIFNQYMKND